MADRVRIYRNLHKGSLSVKDWDRQSDTYGKVIDRPNAFFVSHPRFVVSKAGRDRVLREKRKMYTLLFKVIPSKVIGKLYCYSNTALILRRVRGFTTIPMKANGSQTTTAMPFTKRTGRM